MIQNDEQWLSTREALYHLEHALAALHKDKAKIHPDRFVLMAAGFVEDLLKLRQQIDDYLGVTDTIRTVEEWERAHPLEPNRSEGDRDVSPASSDAEAMAVK